MSMDVKRINPFDGISNVGLGMPSGTKGIQGDSSFRETLAGLQKEALASKGMPPSAGELKFSNHAVERMRSRGVSFTPEQLSKLESAVKKAAQKGGRDSLVLMNDTAVIVSVKNNTVVTVVDKASLKENVFTNIDSTIVI